MPGIFSQHARTIHCERIANITSETPSGNEILTLKMSSVLFQKDYPLALLYNFRHEFWLKL